MPCLGARRATAPSNRSPRSHVDVPPPLSGHSVSLLDCRMRGIRGQSIQSRSRCRPVARQPECRCRRDCPQRREQRRQSGWNGLRRWKWGPVAVPNHLRWCGKRPRGQRCGRDRSARRTPCDLGDNRRDGLARADCQRPLRRRGVRARTRDADAPIDAPSLRRCRGSASRIFERRSTARPSLRQTTRRPMIRSSTRALRSAECCSTTCDFRRPTDCRARAATVRSLASPTRPR